MSGQPQDLADDDLGAVTGGAGASRADPTAHNSDASLYGTSGGFNYQQIAETMGNGTAQTEASLRSFSQTMDPGSTADMIKLQNMTQQWTTAVNLQSATIKMIGDTLKGVVQKIG